MTHFLDENYYEILSDFKVSGFQTDILACWLLNDVHKCVILTLVIGGNFLVFRIGGMYKPCGQMRGEGGCSDDHNT